MAAVPKYGIEALKAKMQLLKDTPANTKPDPQLLDDLAVFIAYLKPDEKKLVSEKGKDSVVKKVSKKAKKKEEGKMTADQLAMEISNSLFASVGGI